MNAKLIMILINVLNAMLLIIAKKNLMEIYLENAYVRMNTMITVKMNYVRSAQIFGILINIILLLNLLLSTTCSYNANNY